jgi:hypothetical protein
MRKKPLLRAGRGWLPLVGMALAIGGGVWCPARAEEAPPPVAAPDPAADAAILDELAALKKRIEELEQLLQQRQPPPAAKPPVPEPPKREPEKPEPAKEEPGKAAPAAAAKPKPADAAKAVVTKLGSKVEFSGYFQNRITNYGNAAGDRTPGGFDFQITRFRPRLRYLMDEHWSAEAELNLSTRSLSASNGVLVPVQVNMRDMFAQWQNAGLQGRFGQAKVPFGYEVYLEGSAERVELERARIFAVLFPDNRDIGVFMRTMPETKTATWAAGGVYNGNGVNREDNNTAKNAVGTIKVPLSKEHVVGVSALAGSFRPADPGPSFVRNALGMEHRFTSGRFFTKMEWLVGRNQGSDLWGGYAGGHYDTGRWGGPFLRYDLMDRDLHAPNDMWQRLAMGWYRDFNKHIRLTGEYDLVGDDTVPSDDLFGVQLQGIF